MFVLPTQTRPTIGVLKMLVRTVSRCQLTSRGPPTAIDSSFTVTSGLYRSKRGKTAVLVENLDVGKTSRSQLVALKHD